MPPINLSLNPYAGPFGPDQASHLLRRTTFTYSQSSRNEALVAGLTDTINQLLIDLPAPSPPLNFGFVDLLTPIGQTWVNNLYLADSAVQRQTSLNAWTMEQMASSTGSIREKMVLFWTNHFGVSNVREPNFLYKYSATLRKHALGNFKALIKEITVDPTMLRFLNGNRNTNNSPNENYARELLELFTIGKGPVAGPGDYTNFTETDVKEVARVLTGWVDTGYRGQLLLLPGNIFLPLAHDGGQKQLSHRFDNATITNSQENEYKVLIDIIFQKDEVARHICRKLYRWFVFYDISPDIESSIIEPLAQVLVANDYEIKPVLDKLLRSQHFYDTELMGCQIKNPYDFILPLFSTLGTATPTRLANRYRFNASLYFAGGILDMVYYDIPQVAGWKAYYQEPVYYRYWINNVTLGLRKVVIDIILITGIEVNNEQIKPDLLDFISTLTDPTDPNQLIQDSANLFFTHSISADQINFYKDALIPGLPDFEWTVEYNNYLADPTDELLKQSIITKLTSLFGKMLNSPDFHLQ